MLPDNNQQTFVYWLHDERCICPWHHGYVGITAHLPVRIAAHRRGNGKGAHSLPPDFRVQVLFVGPGIEALELEARLRPRPGIGWNRAGGGQKSCIGYKHGEIFRQLKAKDAARRFKGVPKSPEQREKIRQAALRRYADPAERERMSEQVKRSDKFKNRDYTGAGNPNYGKTTPETAKQKMRDKIAERGGVDGENNPNFRHGRYIE
jgi:predicted GIY-YIG superfamily endonuclease